MLMRPAGAPALRLFTVLGDVIARDKQIPHLPSHMRIAALRVVAAVLAIIGEDEWDGAPNAADTKLGDAPPRPPLMPPTGHCSYATARHPLSWREIALCVYAHSSPIAR